MKQNTDIVQFEKKQSFKVPENYFLELKSEIQSKTEKLELEFTRTLHYRLDLVCISYTHSLTCQYITCTHRGINMRRVALPCVLYRYLDYFLNFFTDNAVTDFIHHFFLSSLSCSFCSLLSTDCFFISFLILFNHHFITIINCFFFFS